MHLWRSLSSIATGTLLVAASISSTLAQDASVQRAAEIRVGSCDALGDVVAPLVPLSAPGGDIQGQTGATPVEQSATQVPIPLENLLAKDHVVIAHTAPQEVFAPVSCGPIGGAFNDQGALVVGLDAMNGSRINGVAYVLPMPETGSTVVTLLLTPRNATEGDTANAHDPNVPDVVVVAGEDGADGGDGAAATGANGADSMSGMDGADGADGADGQNGQAGQPGEPGTAGASGAGGDGGAGGAGADAVSQVNG